MPDINRYPYPCIGCGQDIGDRHGLAYCSACVARAKAAEADPYGAVRSELESVAAKVPFHARPATREQLAQNDLRRTAAKLLTAVQTKTMKPDAVQKALLEAKARAGKLIAQGTPQRPQQQEERLPGLALDASQGGDLFDAGAAEAAAVEEPAAAVEPDPVSAADAEAAALEAELDARHDPVIDFDSRADMQKALAQYAKRRSEAMGRPVRVVRKQIIEGDNAREEFRVGGDVFVVNGLAMTVPMDTAEQWNMAQGPAGAYRVKERTVDDELAADEAADRAEELNPPEPTPEALAEEAAVPDEMESLKESSNAALMDMLNETESSREVQALLDRVRAARQQAGNCAPARQDRLPTV